MPQSSLVLLRNADVFAPEALGRRDLLVGGGKILWIGAPGTDVLPEAIDGQVLDLDGRRLVPGFIDGHVHVTGGGGEAGFADPRAAGAAVALHPGRRHHRDRRARHRRHHALDRANWWQRCMACATRASRAWGYTGGYHLPPATLTGSVRGDIAFIDCLIGVGELAISDHRSSQPTLDELLRLASEAHVGGLMTGKAGIVHLHLGDGPRGLELVRQALDASELPARVFNPTHVNRRRALFEEALALARRGCTIDITAFPVDEGEDAWPADEALLRYLDSGAPPERVTISSDGGGCLPASTTRAACCSMDVGAPGVAGANPEGAAGAGRSRWSACCRPSPATWRACCALRARAVIAAGADADLVVLDEDSDVSEVMMAGRWFVRDGQARGARDLRGRELHVSEQGARGRDAAGSFRSAAPRKRRTTRRSCSASSSCAAAREADIVVIPTASQLRRHRRALREDLRRPGRRRRRPSIDFDTRRDCEDPACLARSPQASGIFFTGGNQLRLSTILGGTPVAKLIRQRNAERRARGRHQRRRRILSEHMIAFGEEGSLAASPAACAWRRAWA